MPLDFYSARMPNPYLTEEHEEWRSQLRRFINKEIMSCVEDGDEVVRISDQLLPRAGTGLMIHDIGSPPVVHFASEDIMRDIVVR